MEKLCKIQQTMIYFKHTTISFSQKKSAKICWDTEYHLKTCGKLRTNAGDKDTSNAKEVAMAALHNTKYCIPLDHPILADHGVFYPKSLPHPLKFEISLAPVSDVVVFSDTTKSPTYAITNLELEYRCISSKFSRG